ncbi:alpha/beta hydrolase [Saccharicrinis sp. FJH62]|uniref:alpha/beta hydrolase n=1 Tax=Saccharicrinis sp. FJH62 TaxID=3344657 RepID=UPI0035D5054F
MKHRHFTWVIFGLLSIAFLSSCKKYPPIESKNLDSKSFMDSSLIVPSKYLISALDSTPDITKPVIIAAHGYTATPFEWFEFAQYLSKQDSPVYISRVLLGGHGRDYDTFNKTTWQDWQKPILDEYEKLYHEGFRKISLAGSSTGCPLILDLIVKNAFDTLVEPENVFFIDPIIEPSNKLLNYVGILGKFLPYVEVDVTDYEARYWYKYRGEKSLVQLNKLLKVSRKNLKKGITLPSETQHFMVWKVKQDDSAAPESARWLYDGVHFSDGSAIDTVMLNSNLHVFTRLKGRAAYSDQDKELQQEAFNTIYHTTTDTK